MTAMQQFIRNTQKSILSINEILQSQRKINEALLNRITELEKIIAAQQIDPVFEPTLQPLQTAPTHPRFRLN